MKDWRSLGAAHRRRDDMAASLAHTRGERDNDRAAASVARWPGIVRAIEAAVAAYNEGVGRELLGVVETSGLHDPSVTIAATDGTIPGLVITLEGAELNVGNRALDPSSPGIKRWVDLERTDEATAAYVLQEWMERL